MRPKWGECGMEKRRNLKDVTPTPPLLPRLVLSSRLSSPLSSSPLSLLPPAATQMAACMAHTQARRAQNTGRGLHHMRTRGAHGGVPWRRSSRYVLLCATSPACGLSPLLLSTPLVLLPLFYSPLLALHSHAPLLPPRPTVCRRSLTTWRRTRAGSTMGWGMRRGHPPQPLRPLPRLLKHLLHQQHLHLHQQGRRHPRRQWPPRRRLQPQMPRRRRRRWQRPLQHG